MIWGIFEIRELREQRRKDKERIAQLEVGMRKAVVKLREGPENQEPERVADHLERMIS